MLSRVLQEWVFKRLYRFVLKPVLGKLLCSDLDLDQLDVEFLNGTVELRELRLNTEYISEHLNKYGFRLVEGYIGFARAEIPYYGLSNSQIVVSIDRVHLKIQCCEPSTVNHPGGGASELFQDAAAELESETSDDEDELWQSSEEEEEEDRGQGPRGGRQRQPRRGSMIRNSIEMIAGGLEDFLQKLRIDCSEVFIEVISKEEEESEEEDDGDDESSISHKPRTNTKVALKVRQVSCETKSAFDAEGVDLSISGGKDTLSRQISLDGLVLMVSKGTEDTGEAEEFHDAIASPSSCVSTEEEEDTYVPLVGSKSEDGISGLVTLKEISQDGEGAQGSYTSVGVQINAPAVYITPESMKGCFAFAESFSKKKKTENNETVEEEEDGDSSLNRGEEGAAAGGQIDLIDSVLFPDCKSIAADILPAFCVKAEDDDMDTPAEAIELAHSVEEFFDANSRMTAASSSVFQPDASKMISSTILRKQYGEERAPRGPGNNQNALQMVVNVKVDEMLLDIAFERSSGEAAPLAGLNLYLSGINVVKHRYASGIQLDCKATSMGISCYGIVEEEDEKRFSSNALSEAMVDGVPSKHLSEGRNIEIVREIEGRQHVMILSTFSCSACMTEIRFSNLDENNRDEEKEMVEVSLQPFWVLLDGKALQLLIPKITQFCTDVVTCIAGDESSTQESTDARKDKVKDNRRSSSAFAVSCNHIRIVGLTQVEPPDAAAQKESRSVQSMMLLDIMHNNMEERLLRFSFSKHTEIEANLSEIRLSFLLNLQQNAKPQELFHLSSMKEEARGKFRVLVILRERSQAKDADLCKCSWDYLNERFEADAVSNSNRSEAETGDDTLKDFYLQERAINQSQVFVHLSCNQIKSSFNMEDCSSILRFFDGYSSLSPPSEGEKKKKGSKKDHQASSTVTLLLESSFLVEALVQANGKRVVYGLQVDGVRLSASHSSIYKFSMIHLSAQRACVFFRDRSKNAMVVEIVSEPNQNSLVVSCAVRKDQDSMNKVVALLNVKSLLVTVPNFLLEQEGAVIEEVCSIFNEPAAEETPFSLKIASSIGSVSVALDIPPVHDTLEDLSLSRTELNLSVAANLDFEKQHLRIAIYDPSVSLRFRNTNTSSREILEVLKDPKILIHVDLSEEDSPPSVQIFNEEVFLLFNDDSITGLFQLVEYLLEHLKKSNKRKSTKDASCAEGETRDISTYRRCKMEKLRKERKLLKGSDTPWVVIEDLHKESSDSEYDDIDIEGHSCLYSTDGPSVIDDYIPVPAVYEDESVKDEDFEFDSLSTQYPTPKMHFMYRIKALNVLLQRSKTTTSECGEDSTKDAKAKSSQTYEIQCRLSDLSFQFAQFALSDNYVWHTSLAVKRVEMKESFNHKSTFVLFLWETIQHPIEDGSSAFLVDLELTRPDISNASEDEMNAKISILPLRLRLNPNLVHFIADFSTRLAQKVSNLGEAEEGYHFINVQNVTADAVLPYVKRCEVSSLKIRLDYTPQRNHFSSQSQNRRVLIDLLNLVPLHGVELSVKTVVLYDTCGLPECVELVLGEWLQHIAKYQAGKFVVGIRPFKSIFKVGAGAKKLITLPLKEYKEQGNLAHGLKKGAKEFLHAISLEVLQLGANIAGFSENLLDTSLSSTSEESGSSHAHAHHHHQQQPADIKQGLQQASTRLSSGIHAAAGLLFEQWQEKSNDDGASLTNTVVGVLKAVPSAVVAPAGATAGAIRCTLLGARNSLDPLRYYNSKKERENEPQ